MDKSVIPNVNPDMADIVAARVEAEYVTGLNVSGIHVYAVAGDIVELYGSHSENPSCEQLYQQRANKLSV